MRYIRLLKLDVKNGICRNLALWISPVIISLLTFCEAYNRMMRVSELRTEQGISFGDFFFYAYGGMQKYVPSPTNAFQFPAIWIMIFAMAAFLVLNYPTRDLCGTGQQFMVEAKGKRIWWGAKCVWNILGSLLFHLVFTATLVLCCVVMKIPVTSKIHMDLIPMLFELSREFVLKERETLILLVCIVPILLSLALNMLQMVLTLFIKPIFGYIVVLAILLASAYLMSPYMIGNYAMMLRLDWVWNGGISAMTGVVVSGVILVISILAGMIKVHHMDILRKE